MPTTDLTPGTVTTLGALRPGDVGAFVHDNGVQTPRFAFLKIVERPGWGRVAVAQFEGGGYIDELWLARPVRYLGRGRIEPARIVMEGEPDRIAELEAQVRMLRGIAVKLDSLDWIPGYDLVGGNHAILGDAMDAARAFLAATAPKEEIPAK